jgi:hypothetical protein
MHTAIRTVTEHLRWPPLAERLRELPRGHELLVREPEGAAPPWAELRAAAAERFPDAQAA